MSENNSFFIGNQIKALMSSVKASQTTIAERTGVSKGHISNLVDNKKRASRAFIISLCRAYGVSKEYFETGAGLLFSESHEERVANEERPAYRVESPREEADISDLLEKAAKVLRHKWKGKYEVSLRQNIDSFFEATETETILYGESPTRDEEKEQRRKAALHIKDDLQRRK